MLNDRILSDAQCAAVDRLVAEPITYLVAEPGAGKTIVALSALQRLLAAGIIHRALVIAPLKVISSAWVRELAIWPQLADLTHAVIWGTPRERLAQLHRAVQIRLINDDLAGWLVKAARSAGVALGDCLVVDEITRWGAAGSQRVRALRGHKWTRAVALTATPVAESWEGLYSHLLLLDGGARLGRNLRAHRERYFTPVGYQGYQHELQHDGAERISAAITDVVYQLRGAYTLPPLTVQHVPVRLPPHALRALHTLQRRFVLDYDGHQIVAPSAAVLSLKLAQGASGAFYASGDGCERGAVVPLHGVKMAWLRKRLETRRDEQVVVVYHYRYELATLRAALGSTAAVLTGLRGCRLQEVISAWQRGDVRVILLHPASAGHGVDGLQLAGAHLIWLAPPWSREQWIQTNGRLWRQGQTRPVTVQVISAVGTIDALKWQTVERKKDFEVLFKEFLGLNSVSPS